jgi:hypothetical protein
MSNLVLPKPPYFPNEVAKSPWHPSHADEPSKSSTPAVVGADLFSPTPKTLHSCQSWDSLLENFKNKFINCL